jgi:hypothetical protein
LAYTRTVNGKQQFFWNNAWHTVPNPYGGSGMFEGVQVTPPPAAVPAGSAGAPEAPQAPPFQGDSSYFAQLGQDTFDRQNKLNDLTTQEGYDKTDLAEALRRRAEQHPKDVQSTNESYNRSGLLFSGKRGEAQSDLETQYTRQNTDDQTAFDRRQAARAAARAAIEQGQPIAQAALYAQSVDRQVGTAQAAADTGALAPPPPAPQQATTSTAKTRKVGGKTQWYWHGAWHTVPPR